MIRREGNAEGNSKRKANGEAQDQLYEDLQQREFSSIFAFKIRIKGSNKPIPQNNISKIIDLIAAKSFKFESETYKSGFGKPLMFGKEILVVPYYDIVKEEVREDVTNKENPGEIKPEIRLMPVQKVRYIIDTNIFANEGLVYMCKINSLDSAKTLLTEYLRTIQIYQDCICGFVYDLHSEILQQLLTSLYDYWSTSESQVTSIKIGGRTISANYSGKGMYDVRLEDANEEIRNRIMSHELVESITLKAPIGLVAIGGSTAKRHRYVPKISINNYGKPCFLIALYLANRQLPWIYGQVKNNESLDLWIERIT